jgi:zinc transport system ATP-binding protein
LGKKKAIREGLEKIEAAHLEKRMLGSLSGGEFQRVLLALALQVEPDILLLDEPAAGVDLAGEELFCDFLSDLQKEGNFTLVLVSHDLSVVSSHAERVLCLNRTVSCSGKTAEILTSDNLDRLYGGHHSVYYHDDRCVTLCRDDTSEDNEKSPQQKED